MAQSTAPSKRALSPDYNYAWQCSMHMPMCLCACYACHTLQEIAISVDKGCVLGSLTDVILE